MAYFFTSELETVQKSRWEWQLVAPLDFYASGELLRVPTGYLTNFASVRALRTAGVILLGITLALSLLASIWQPVLYVAPVATVLGLGLLLLYAMVAGYGNASSTLHDWLYDTGDYPRRECDHLFYQALRDEGVARWRALVMWAGVRLGGYWAYQSNT